MDMYIYFSFPFFASKLIDSPNELPFTNNTLEHAKKFTLPPDTHVLRFRYTYYMGEHHPAEHKVVVELCSQDLVPKYLTEDQRQTFLKLVGTRYNPDTDIVRMSTEKFDSRAKNKRYLGDLVKSLIHEAKDGDSFADIPLDLRHHKPKVRHVFPESWKLTEERRNQLVADREQRRLAEADRAAIIHGKEAIAQAVSINPALSGIVQGNDERTGSTTPISNKIPPRRQR
jgi:small subunit ribosomal protein S35